ncbi:u3 small nucleolar RNA-associated protein 11 [Phlebopus sp. FC_14]|nr:u3 small nucleolar RNA-associated protein 11 [Phlebopus sp. FC_14]
MTSSLRNSLHRRNHKERSQLAHRARFGILEKHKDYVLRARDYHSKQDRLTRLRQKAADRNKDEFYFAMNKERTVEGVHVKERGNVAMPMDMVKLLKTQDEGYIRTMRTVGLKKIDKIKRQLTDLANLISPSDEDLQDDEEQLAETELQTLRDAGIIPTAKRKQRHTTPRHIVFAEDEVDGSFCPLCTKTASHRKRQDTKLDKAADPGPSTAQVDLGWKLPKDANSQRRRKRKSVAGSQNEDGTSNETQRFASIQKQRTRLLKELASRLARDTQLLYTLRELEMQRLLVGKGGRKKLQGVEEIGVEDEHSDEDIDKWRSRRKPDQKTYRPRIYRWRIERKR